MVWSDLFSNLMILNWADTVEIVIISYVVYRLSQWLGQDKKTALLPTFYGYCLLTIACYHASLVTATLLLCIAAPILLVSFLLIHQKTLQKNYVAFKKTSAETQPQVNWLNQLLRSILMAVNTGKPIFMLLENTDSLATFVTCTFPINAPVSHQLLTMLLRSDCYQSNTMLWLTRTGTLMGINTTWTYELDDMWFDQELRSLETWKQNALFISKKTDALFISLEPVQHTFTIIAQGVALEHMSLEQVLYWFKQQSWISVISPEKSEGPHAPYMVQKSHQQHTT